MRQALATLARRNDLNLVVVMQACLGALSRRDKRAIHGSRNTLLSIIHRGAELFQCGGLRFPRFTVHDDLQR